MSKVKIDKNDYSRILLTELLPYEVPMLFSNEGFYSIVANNEHLIFLEKMQRKSSYYGIPFNYNIQKSSDGDSRTLSIINPINQLNFIDFYKDYDSVIIHLCSKSTFSLRAVSRVAKFSSTSDLVFEEDLHKNAEKEIEPDIAEYDPQVLKSYFTYKPIDLIYKFYDRNDYQRLEQRFDQMWEFDISKCFYHIYTHSITWAVKDKESAKKHHTIEMVFENRFDKIMQWANYNETNGIIVGPEISRIFAEIILQQVDINVLEKLNNHDIKLGVNYEIRRYVDDFFVFSNDSRTLEKIFNIYRKELEFYKLYLNPSKTKKTTSPFITNIAVGKRQVVKLVNDFFYDIMEVGDNTIFKKISRPYNLSQKFIKDFQCVVKLNNLTYDAVNKDVVRLFKQKLVAIFRDDKILKEQERFEPFILTLLDIVYYCYSLNITTNATFKISQIIVLLAKFLEDKELDFKHTVFSKIFRESEFVMTVYQRKIKHNETNIEFLNLLIALTVLGSEYIFTEKKIREFFGLTRFDGDKGSDDVLRFTSLNYFQIVTLFYYFNNNPIFERVKLILEKSVVKRFENTEDHFVKSEMVLLFFDFISCPFVTDASKQKIMVHSNYCKTDFKKEIDGIMDKKKWFMDWDTSIDLEAVLKKKEWVATY